MDTLLDADSDVGEGTAVRYFRQALVDIVLAKALPFEMIAACRQDQLTIVIETLTEAWSNAVIGPIAERFQGVPKEVKPFLFKRSPVKRIRSERTDPDYETVLSKLMSGASIVGVFCPTSESFPLLTDAPDFRIAVARPSYADVAQALSEVTGKAIDGAQIPRVNTVDLDTLCSLVRPRASLEQTLARLRAATDIVAKSDGIPTIHELAGYGDAKRWALSAVNVIEAIRAGDAGVSMADLPRGALLVGPPGVGKSIFARSLAKTLGVQAVITSVSAWLSSGDTHLGTVISAARSSIEKAASYQPGLLFIDEVDSLVDRDLEKGSSASWWINFINAVLTAIDGAVKTPGLIVVGACNDLDRVDKALKRSGRLETVVHIGLPDEADRLSIFAFYVKGAVGRDELRTCAVRAAGLSGADIQRIVREARQAAREEGRPLASKDLLDAMAPRNHLSASERQIAARHEAGHALASLLLGERLIAVDIDRGVTHLKPLPGILEADTIDRALTILMAGRAADELLTGDANSGAGGALISDLGQATSLAVARHASFGLGDTLAFRGTIQDALNLLETDRDLQAEVEHDLQTAYDRTLDLLARHEADLQALAGELAMRGFMRAEEIFAFLDARKGALS